MEIWRSLEHFNNFIISNEGRVKNLNSGNILKGTYTKKGYLCVCLWQNKKSYTKRVHRLVAQTFIENKYNKPYVNHKNLNKSDNRVINLEWVTHNENMQHFIKHNNGNIIPSTGITASRKVKCSNGMIFDSSYKAAEWLNLKIFKGTKNVRSCARRIRECCLNKRAGNIYKSSFSFGFKWTQID